MTLLAVASAVGGLPDSPVDVRETPKLSRWKRVLIGVPRTIFQALRIKADLYHLHDPELAIAVPIFRLLGKKVVYDAHEDLPVQVAHKPYLNNVTRTLAKATAYAVVMVAGWSNGIIAATEPVARRFPVRKTVVVKNYPRLRNEEMAPKDIAERSNRVVYIGALDGARGARNMVRSLEEAEFPSDWSMVMAGIAPKETLSGLAEEIGWSSVAYLGVIAPSAAREILLDCKLGYVLLEDSPAYREALPTKMFEYFAAGLPVVASDFPLWRQIIEESDCGIVVDQTSPEAIAAAVLRYAENRELLERHSLNARKAALLKYNWATQSSILVDFYGRLLDQ